MLNWLQPPTSPLIAQYVEQYWLIEKKQSDHGYAFPKLNPDPSAHLILSPHNQAYHYDLPNYSASGTDCHLIFPHHNTFQLDHTQPFIHIGVKFRIGALYSLELTDYPHPTLDCIADIHLPTLLHDHNLDISSLFDLGRYDAKQYTRQCAAQLDELLMPWFEARTLDRHSKLTHKALDLLGSTPISNLGEALFCSQRTVERSFNKVTGLTLKQCQSMQKLEAILEYLSQRDTNEIDWVDVALKFGFSDQPHLIRHLKQQLGITPSLYAKERGLAIDVYGGITSL